MRAAAARGQNRRAVAVRDAEAFEVRHDARRIRERQITAELQTIGCVRHGRSVGLQTVCRKCTSRAGNQPRVWLALAHRCAHATSTVGRLLRMGNATPSIVDAPPTSPTVWPGTWYPLGATFDGAGCNFSVFSEVAERVELCLFDEDGSEQRVDLPETRTFCWHGYVPAWTPGQRYGFRVHGPWDPARGLRCNPAQAAARSVRQGDRRPGRLEARRLSVHIDADGTRHEDERERDRQRAARAALDRRRQPLRLGRRPAAPPAAAPDRDLRAARQGLHGADAGRPAASCAAPTPASPIRRRSIT